jgi:ABC-2 type transport system permease protein
MIFHRIWTLFKARNLEFLRDKGSLGWAIVFPVIVIFGFSFMFSGKSKDVFKVGIHGTRPAQHAIMKVDYLEFVDLPDLDKALQKLRHHQIDMLLSTTGDGAPDRFWINESSPKGYLLERILGANSGFKKDVVSGREIRYVDWLVAGLFGMNVMFAALFGVGYVIVRYRKTGVLKRFKATPLHAVEFLTAQILSRLFLILLTTVTIFAACKLIVDFTMLGSYWTLFAILVSGSFCLISMSLIVAARVSSEELAGGLLNLLSMPMMFLSGVWFSLEGSPSWVMAIARVFPLTHMIDAARAVMTEGATFAEVAPQIGLLSALSIVFLGFGAAMFRWDS